MIKYNPYQNSKRVFWFCSFCFTDKLILKFVQRSKAVQTTKTILKTKTKFKDSYNLISRLTIKLFSIDIKQIYIAPWNRNLEIEPHMYGQFIFKKGAKVIQWGTGWSLQQ